MSKSAPLDVIAADSAGKICKTEIFPTEASRKIARDKTTTDGDLIKECIMAVIDSLCPEKRSAFENVSLTLRTVCCCIEEMSDSLNDSLKTCYCSNFDAFSLGLDESTDMKDNQAGDAHL